MSGQMRVEVFPTGVLRGSCWNWHLRAANGEILAHSEAYTRKWSAKRTARKLVDTLGCELLVLEP